MFRLYKERNFSALINDTFSFFKSDGKNFFRNYFVINGGLMAILLLLGFIVGKVFFRNMFVTATSQESAEMLDNYFASNEGFFIGMGIFAFVLFLVLTLMSYSFPVLYLKLKEDYDKPTASQVFGLLKKRLGRIVLFGLASLIIFVPIGGIVGLFSMLMFALVITIPVAIILIGAFSSWFALAFYDYINTDNSYFTAVGNGFTMLFKKFWPHTGTTVIFYIIISVVQSIISFIPYIIGAVMLFSDIGNNGQPDRDQFSMLGLLMLITFMLYMVLSYVLSNVIIVNQGMIYYSCRESEENRSVHSEIDLIGKDFE